MTRPPTPPTPPAGRSRGRHRAVHAAAAALLACAPFAGTAAMLQHTTAARTRFVGVREVVIDLDAGAVALTRADDAQTGVDTSGHWLLTTPAPSAVLDDGMLRVTAHCHRLDPTCSVQEHLSVPAGVPVHVRTRSAPISATDLDVPTLDAVSGAGAIDVSLTRPARDVQIQTATGPVHVALPTGIYQVEATGPAGAVSVTVPSNPSGPNRITAHSQAGPIAVDAVDTIDTIDTAS